MLTFDELQTNVSDVKTVYCYFRFGSVSDMETVGNEQMSLRFRQPAVDQQNSAAQTTLVLTCHFAAMESLTALMDPTSSIVVCDGDRCLLELCTYFSIHSYV